MTTDIAVPIGVQHNHTQDIVENVGGFWNSPPVSTAVPRSDVDIMPHFYNDAGLRKTFLGGGTYGALEWNTWKWNHVGNTQYGAYDPARHPTLGWYRGDDPVVLDWICYWLREYGCKGTFLSNMYIDYANWHLPANPSYWLYVLMKQVPNFEGLEYILTCANTDTEVEFLAHWSGARTNIFDVHDNYYKITFDGKVLPVIGLRDISVVRGGYFANTAAFETWCADWATYFQGKGHDGVAIISKNSSYYTDDVNSARFDAMAAQDVYIFDNKYGTFTGTYAPEVHYTDYIAQFDTQYAASSLRTIPNVCTARVSKYHGSAWNFPGHSPARFGKVFDKAVTAVKARATVPNIVTAYNVAEWGEGGPGLIPNMQDGFGYLEALR